jgi:signal transduction histidine kinase
MMEKFAGYVEGIYQIECDFSCETGCGIDDPDIAINIFRITQEAVSNAVKHGRATHVELRIGVSPSNRAQVEILDDGCGIADANILEGAGLGMRTMRYRAELIGASLEVGRRIVGGTRVAVSMPE